MINNYIEKQAERLIGDAIGDSFGATDVSKCADHLNIAVHPAVLDSDVSGFLVLNDEGPYIGFNKSHNEHRSRFTIAHEIGHYILHKNDSRLFIDRTQKAEQRILFRDNGSSTGEFAKEREANSFAAALLMPRKAVEVAAAYRNTSSDEELIEELAKIFNVSKQAMQIRLANLSIIDYDSV